MNPLRGLLLTTLLAGCLSTSPLGLPELQTLDMGDGDGDGDGDGCITGFDNGRPLVECADECVDLTNDAQNCGGCGAVCGPDASCKDSRCQPACDEPRSRSCDGFSCQDIYFDPLNCGGCGFVCGGPGAYCEAGQCFAGCLPGELECGGICIFVDDDINNCGACQLACPQSPEFSTVCNAGTCEIDCFAGFADCDGDIRTGCEVELSTDSRNCGGCRIQCPADARCVDSQCVGGAGGILITQGDIGYGHHGACEGWNGCFNAATCADWACQYRGFSGAVSWGREGECGEFAECYLFNTPDDLDEAWGNGAGWCPLLGVGEIYCR